MLTKALRLALVPGLLVCLVARGAASQESLGQQQIFSLTANVPPGSVETPFGLVPKDTYVSWHQAFATGVEGTTDVAQALQYRTVRHDVPLCPWGQYWSSAATRCVGIIHATTTPMLPAPTQGLETNRR